MDELEDFSKPKTPRRPKYPKYDKYEHYYILVGHEAVPCRYGEYFNWYENADRTVAKTKVGDVEVSTVFLGINHGWDNGSPPYIPAIFETMIFGVEFQEYQQRYPTWEAAQRGHDEIVRKLKNGEPL